MWQRKLEQRKVAEKALKKTGKQPWGYAETFYTTATDMERMIRAFATADMEGTPREQASGMFIGGGVRISTGMRGTLLDACRQWLLRNPKISSHNFGRGHISGQRFRPVGQPIGPAEQVTMQKKAERRANPRPRLYHYTESEYGGRPWCTRARRSAYSWRPSRHVCTTHNQQQVTCPRCLKMLAADPQCK